MSSTQPPGPRLAFATATTLSTCIHSNSAFSDRRVIFTASAAQAAVIVAVAWSHRMEIACAAARSISVYDAAGGLVELIHVDDGSLPNELRALTFSSKSSRYLFHAGTAQVVAMYDRDRRLTRTFTAESSAITALGVDHNPEGSKRVVSGSASGGIVVHSLASNTTTVLKSPFKQAITSIAFSANHRARFAAAGDEGIVAVWDATSSTRDPIAIVPHAHEAPIRGLAIVNIGKEVLCSVGLDCGVRVFEVAAGVKPRMISELITESPLTCCSVFNDFLVAGNTQGAMIVVNLRTMETTRVRGGNDNKAVQCVAFQPPENPQQRAQPYPPVAVVARMNPPSNAASRPGPYTPTPTHRPARAAWANVSRAGDVMDMFSPVGEKGVRPLIPDAKSLVRPSFSERAAAVSREPTPERERVVVITGEIEDEGAYHDPGPFKSKYLRPFFSNAAVLDLFSPVANRTDFPPPPPESPTPPLRKSKSASWVGLNSGVVGETSPFDGSLKRERAKLRDAGDEKERGREVERGMDRNDRREREERREREAGVDSIGDKERKEKGKGAAAAPQEASAPASTTDVHRIRPASRPTSSASSTPPHAKDLPPTPAAANPALAELSNRIVAAIAVASAAEPTSAATTTPSSSAPSFNYTLLRNVVDDCLVDFKEQIHADVRNMHLELLRQFHIQKVGVAAYGSGVMVVVGWGSTSCCCLLDIRHPYSSLPSRHLPGPGPAKDRNGRTLYSILAHGGDGGGTRKVA
ncbi:WD40-repeat-containing domain protein [Blyttiomyces helicus]|uniref:WD40-repeat-containing domain protein n=1 Tax=Blyttiomyces helicus TaxID=388810 RepID=A0A4P9WH19_9FUNG|nr:WD40-repeat-containing domain protein [Blyttiomyces helicus]|eukprot:RKO92109.1 WD40-repeat-containing domain protein [Blyttiomyces helicus]